MGYEDKGHTLDAPATYQIVIEGTLGASWSDRLGGMTIVAPQQTNAPAVTTLIGYLPDQAAVVGVLNTLHELGLPVLSMARLGGEAFNPEESIDSPTQPS